jgi:hypothetical protein
MRTPPTYVICRAAAVTITVLVLLLLGMGLDGRGPLAGLSGLTSHAAGWLQGNSKVVIR